MDNAATGPGQQRLVMNIGLGSRTHPLVTGSDGGGEAGMSNGYGAVDGTHGCRDPLSVRAAIRAQGPVAISALSPNPASGFCRYGHAYVAHQHYHYRSRSECSLLGAPDVPGRVPRRAVKASSSGITAGTSHHRMAERHHRARRRGTGRDRTQLPPRICVPATVRSIGARGAHLRTVTRSG